MAGRKRVSKTLLSQRLVAFSDGFSVDQIAAGTETKARTVESYLRGDSVPDADFLRKFVGMTDADPSHILMGGPLSAELAKTKPNHSNAPPAHPISPAIDLETMELVSRVVERVYREANIRLPADAVIVEIARRYNELVAKAGPGGDRDEIASLLPWLETRLRKELSTARAEPGTGKQSA